MPAKQSCIHSELDWESIHWKITQQIKKHLIIVPVCFFPLNQPTEPSQRPDPAEDKITYIQLEHFPEPADYTAVQVQYKKQ